MKTFINFFLVLFVLQGFISCDKIDELTEVDFDTTINEQLNVTVQAGENMVLNETMLININNQDTEKYLNVIQNVRITSFTYRLIDFSGDSEGTIVGNFVADGVQLVDHDMIVKQIVDAGTIFEVTNVAQLNTIASKLKSGKDVLIGVEGESKCSEAMIFTMAVTIDLEVTADVL
ncbi:hypothetical protein [Algibacter sp.]|uniref:hypothetical protein n=1 Tax=Algibacter sp. TaxID=1872428 RepID=UPI003C790DB2